MRSREQNEFWGPLLEKAYAKYHGSYKALEGGVTLEAAVDFTGGIPEVFDDIEDEDPERLFKIMIVAARMGAFMGTSLAVSLIYWSQVSNGLTPNIQSVFLPR